MNSTKNFNFKNSVLIIRLLERISSNLREFSYMLPFLLHKNIYNHKIALVLCSYLKENKNDLNEKDILVIL